MVIQKVEQIEWMPVDALNVTDRNQGGFGSTGVK
jgi:dUTPase